MSQLTATRSLLSGNEAIARGAWEAGVTVATGEFGARMRVELTNDGPVTIMLDTRDR